MDIKRTREELRKGRTIYDMPLRVVYYARVSTDKDDQLNSLENQQNYFEEMIKENKNWIFCGGYIDEGISGTAVKNRDEFLKMIEASTLGKIDLILTKEISRFSRNTVDSIKYTEYLLKNGVIVYFLSDNLNTIQEDAEFRLTIMSSLAQDEVRKLSERVKFGINRMIKDRKLIGGNLTGYYKKNGRYEINPNESPIITYLFETYASGKVGLKKIGEDLAKMGYLNSKGQVYSQTTMAKFLTNPRYKGYYTARLTEVEDYKTHRKRKVPKERQIIERDDRIPAIVSEELWDKANYLHTKRKQSSARHVLNTEKSLNTAKYSCLIYCKHCGNVYIRAGGSNRVNNPTWACKKYKKEGVSACESPILREEYLDKIFIDIFNDFLDNKKEYLNLVLKEYENIIGSYRMDNNADGLKGQISVVEKQKDKLLDLSLKGIIDDIEFKKRNDKFNLDIQEMQTRLDKMSNPDLEYKKMQEKIEEVRKVLVKKINVKEQLPNLMKVLVERIEVEKINNDRKHVKLIIYFNFKADIISRELEIDNRKGRACELSNFCGSKCSPIAKKIQNGQYGNTNLNLGNPEITGNSSLLCTPITQKQSWCLYENTYKFIDNALNGKKITQILEVHTTSDFTYNGEIYNIAEDFKTPKDCLSVVSNHIRGNRKINNRLYDINTNSYKNLITNKDAEIVDFYNEIEEYVLRKDNKIIRNYLKKGVTFKYKKRIMEVMIKEKELLITFLKDVKIYDSENRLLIRKGYENSSLCYVIHVNNYDSLNYSLKLFNHLYDIITDPYQNNYVNILLKNITSQIKNIDRSVKLKKINKGIMFCANRNFAMIEKRKYGLHIRLLPVEDNNNLLGVVGRCNLEPLCRFFKVKEEKDIELVMPLIKKSFNKTKYPAFDIKKGLDQFYARKDTNYVK